MIKVLGENYYFDLDKIEEYLDMSNEMTDEAILKTIQDSGIDITGMSPETLSGLKSSIMSSIKTGVKPDTAALVRKAEFETLGIKPTLGQITRTPEQFSQERNLRGLIPSISNRFVEQGQKMRGLLDELSSGSQEPYAAGKSIMSPLEQYLAPSRGAMVR